ncbi:MAG: phosphonate metabolism protein PhnM [Anaerolineae bacterium]|nr:phosphonate metabolism protein PhnM [Anaerolineae bacterium]
MWLSDLKIVMPDDVIERGSLLIEDGKIAEIIEGPAPINVPSMRGLTLIPGMIDLHGDMLERDVQPRPSARFPTDIGLLELDKRLAGAGITTAFCAISFAWRNNDLRSQESATEMIETVNRMNGQTLVDMRVHGRFEVNNTETAPILKDLLERGLLQLVSIMDHTPGQGQYKDVDRYLNFMHRWLGMDISALGTSREEILEKMKSNIMEYAEAPRDWDVIAEVLKVAIAYGIPVSSHDDDTADKVNLQAEMGVSISEFPVSIEAAQAAHNRGMWIVMGAPNAYRGQSTSNNLSAMDAIEAGLVDILATDYYPAAMLHTVFKLAKQGAMPLNESVKLVSTNAANAMHMDDLGSIEVGKSADIVIVHEADDFPRVRGTIRAGNPIYWDNHLASLSQLNQLFQLTTASVPQN